MRYNIKKAVVAAAASVLMCVGLAGCAGADPASDEAPTLNLAVPSGITTLNPILNGTGLPNQLFIQPAYDSLIRRAPDGSLVPGLATEWSYSDANTKFHIELRPDVEFSNGEELTAQGVADWITWSRDSNGLFSSFFADVTDVTVDGPLSLTMNLSMSDAKWPAIFTQDRLGFVVCPAALKDPDSLGTSTCGAGPYVYDDSQSAAGTKYVYTPNPTFWDKDSVKWGEVVLKVVSDPNAVVSAMSSGQVNVAIGSPQTASSAESAGIEVVSAPANWNTLAVINRFDGPLADVKVRQAMEYAVDRETVTKAVFGEFGQPNTSLVLPGVPGYSEELGSQYTYDPEKAKKLLAEAGYPDGFDFTLMSINRRGLENTLAQAILPYYEEIGIRINLEILPAGSGELVTGLQALQWPAFVFNGTVQASNLTAQDQFLPNAGLLNPTKYVDQPLIDLNDAYNKAETEEEQQAALEALSAYIVDNAYYISFAISDVVYFHTTDVTGVDVSGASANLNLYTLEPAS